MPTIRSPTQKSGGDESRPDPADHPTGAANPTQGRTDPSTPTTSRKTDPPTPSKGILKMSKVELIRLLRELRSFLGKPTDTATMLRLEGYTKENLIDEYYTLRTASKPSVPDPVKDPPPAQPASSQQEITEMFLAARRENDKSINEANRRIDAMLTAMDQQRRDAAEDRRVAGERLAQERQEALDRLEQQRRDAEAAQRAAQQAADERMAQQQREADDRFEKLLTTFQRLQQVPVGDRPVPDAPANPDPAVPAQQAPRGPRTFDYSAVSQLSQESTYRQFREWQESWTNNARVKQFDAFDRQTQVYSIVSAAGPHASKVLKTHLSIDLDAAETTADVVLQGLQTYYRDQRSVVVDRVAFRKCKQKQGETFDEFRFRLVDLAEDADLCEACRDTQIVTQVIYGLRNEKAKNELLQKREFPTLEDTVKLCRAFEVADRNQARLEGREIGRVSNYRRDKQQTQQREASSRGRSRSTDRDNSEKCRNCGRGVHKSRDDCPARDAECHGCKRKGHYTRVCRSKGQTSGNSSVSNSSTNSATAAKTEVKSVICASVSDANDEDEDPLCPLETVTVEIRSANGSKRLGSVSATPDTGAAANIMSKAEYKRLGREPKRLRRPSTVLNAYNGLAISLIGQDILTVRLGNKSTKRTFFITDEGRGVLLSRATSRALGLIPEEFPNQVVNNIQAVDADNASETDRSAVRAELLAEFADVFDDESQALPPMRGEPVHIELKEDAKPFQVNGPRPIPLPLRHAAKGLIEDLQVRGVIAPVHEPTDWLHPATFVPKKPGSDKLRLCVDLRKLNAFVKRPQHPVRTPKDCVSSVPPSARFFATFDAKMGYFQVPLDEESQLLTTFCTPWGRFKHLRATMGLTSAGDEYNRRTDAELSDIPRTEKIVDDILVYDSSWAAHVDHVRQFLTRCRRAGITLNPKKFKLGEDKVSFAGYIVGADGIRADPDKLKAVRGFPKPTNITDLRSFLGLCEQLAGFSAETASKMGPLRPLLKTKAEFIWCSEHDRAFEEVKQALTSPPVLALFDPRRPTRLETDASRTRGLSYALLQQDPDGNWRLIEAQSRFITETEARYAMIELELLAVRWAMRKAHTYLFGLPTFTLVVDHQPLLSILNRQTLDCIDNARLQRLKADLTAYQFVTVWKKGKDHRIPDALSRAPVSDPTPEDLDDEQELYGCVSMVARVHAAAIDHDLDEDRPVSNDLADPILNELQTAAQADDEYKRLLDYLRSDTRALPEGLRHYGQATSEMSITPEELILYRQRLLIPRSFRREVLKRLHAAHQGINRTLRRARQSVYWPGITNDVTSTVGSCEACQTHLPSLAKEPLLADALPTRVFQEVAADFFEIGNKHYLAVVDRLSGYPVIASFNVPPTAASTIDRLKQMFTTFGCPNRLFSDGGRQFTAQDTQDFLRRWGVSHRLSTAHYPQSNGLAESAVKALKTLLLKTGGRYQSDEFNQGLLELRNAPRAGGKSPAEIVFGQPLRSLVPAHHSAFDKRWLATMDDYDKKVAQAQEKATADYNKTAHELRELAVNAPVRIQDPVSKLWDKTGIILSRGQHRNYRVRLPSGRCYWRNRRLLRPDNVPVLEEDPDNDDSLPVGNQPVSETAHDAPKTPRRSKRVRFAPSRLSY